MKTVWKFWTMFHFGKLEAWLGYMAKQGWIFQRVKFGYGFVFKKMKPANIVYRFDYRGYLLEDYMQELIHNGWVMTKINKKWIIWSRPSNDPNLMIKSHYNEDILSAMKRFTLIQMVLCVLTWVLPRYVLVEELKMPLVMAVYIIFGLMMTYNVIRCYFYQAMVEVR